MSSAEKSRILVINGPNLNMLGIREPSLYGVETLKDTERWVQDEAKGLGLSTDFFQSNHEGALIDAIHAARTTHHGVIINPGGFTHTSIALRDALQSVSLPFVEVHITNIYKREPFRHHSYLSDLANTVIVGGGINGYRFALEALAHTLQTHNLEEATV